MGCMIALPEYIFLILLWIATLLSIFVIFKRRSLTTFIKESPTLTFIFGFTAILGLNQVIGFTWWTLLITHALPTVPLTGNTIVVVNILSISIQAYYDTFTIVLLLQRIAVLSDPTRTWRTLNQFLYITGLMVPTLLLIYFLVIYLPLLSAESNPLPEGCCALICSKPLTIRRTIMNARVTLSLTNVLLGTVFIILFLIRKKPLNTNTTKINQLTRFLFFGRLILEVIPLAVDSAFIMVTGITIGYYIGAFGAIGCSIEEFLFIFVYYFVFKPKKHVVPRLTRESDTKAG
ncbi:hypothetical protein QR680_010088 [Steinernema hermaphroditum]|uniref:Uncharacterized protein n=1 Tax=Steinernema hermaphroditum TaxID=289476 RepID=A0AA39MB44_9BILA|nr:hypothetical protein QR680_010088 [Steinernema hermaphroditum]